MNLLNEKVSETIGPKGDRNGNNEETLGSAKDIPQELKKESMQM